MTVSPPFCGLENLLNSRIGISQLRTPLQTLNLRLSQGGLGCGARQAPGMEPDNDSNDDQLCKSDESITSPLTSPETAAELDGMQSISLQTVHPDTSTSSSGINCSNQDEGAESGGSSPRHMDENMANKLPTSEDTHAGIEAERQPADAPASSCGSSEPQEEPAIDAGAAEGAEDEGAPPGRNTGDVQDSPRLLAKTPEDVERRGEAEREPLEAPATASSCRTTEAQDTLGSAAEVLGSGGLNTGQDGGAEVGGGGAAVEEEAPEGGAPEGAAPEGATPEEGAPEEVAPEGEPEGEPKEAAPEKRERGREVEPELPPPDATPVVADTPDEAGAEEEGEQQLEPKQPLLHAAPAVDTAPMAMEAAASGAEPEPALEAGEEEDDGDGFDWAAAKHIFVLSSAGKPVFSLSGDEQQLSTLMGMIQALLSLCADCDGGDELESISAGGRRFVFLKRGNLVLVAVSSSSPPFLGSDSDADEEEEGEEAGGEEPECESFMRLQLEYLYASILFLLTSKVCASKGAIHQPLIERAEPLLLLLLLIALAKA